MDMLRTAYKWAARTARLMVGIPDYETYVQHRRTAHPGVKRFMRDPAQP